MREKLSDPSCIFLGIFDKNSDKHIGNVKLEPVDHENKETCLGILIGDKSYWGRGICTEVVKMLIEYSFKVLKLDYVFLGVLPGNKAAIKCYEKAGMKIERIDKAAKQYDGVIYDSVIMGIRKQY